MSLTPNKLKVYEIIVSIVWRCIFSLMAIVIIFWDLPHLIDAKDWFELLKHGLIEFGFGSLIAVTWRFWFFGKNEGDKKH